jgi:hypothetical protein
MSAKIKIIFFKLKITTTDKKQQVKSNYCLQKNEAVIKYKKRFLLRNSKDIKHYLFTSFKKCARYI